MPRSCAACAGASPVYPYLLPPFFLRVVRFLVEESRRFFRTEEGLSCQTTMAWVLEKGYSPTYFLLPPRVILPHDALFVPIFLPTGEITRGAMRAKCDGPFDILFERVIIRRRYNPHRILKVSYARRRIVFLLVLH